MIKLITALIILLIIVMFYYSHTKKEAMVTFNNTTFDPLPDGLENGAIYGDGTVYYLVSKQPDGNYYKIPLEGFWVNHFKDNVKGLNRNLDFLQDMLPLGMQNGETIRVGETGALGRFENGELKYWTHPDSYNYAGTPAIRHQYNNNNNINGKFVLDYSVPKNMFTRGLKAGPFYTIDREVF